MEPIEQGRNLGGKTQEPKSADAGTVDVEPPDVESTPEQLAPCATAQCWQAPVLSSCGTSTVMEGFSSGKYNVHEYHLVLTGGTKVDLKLDVTGGESFGPALVVNAANGTTLFDGQIGASGVTSTSSGQEARSVAVSLTANEDQEIRVFVTGRSVVDSDFVTPMPADATYTLTSTTTNCEEPPPGKLLSPPNFDPTNKNAGGYYLLPDSVPAGLYTHKAEDCSRGNKLLIDVIYTVTSRWKPLYPALAPVRVSDMNEGKCSTVNHATHDDGTHVDISAGCATDISCTNKQPKIALAKLIVDTGAACGILNNDVAVQGEINDYFAKQTNYAPWKGKFMRSVSGHTKHFHVRVKKPNGECN